MSEQQTRWQQARSSFWSSCLGPCFKVLFLFAHTAVSSVDTADLFCLPDRAAPRRSCASVTAGRRHRSAPVCAGGQLQRFVYFVLKPLSIELTTTNTTKLIIVSIEKICLYPTFHFSLFHACKLYYTVIYSYFILSILTLIFCICTYKVNSVFSYITFTSSVYVFSTLFVLYHIFSYFLIFVFHCIPIIL